MSDDDVTGTFAIPEGFDATLRKAEELSQRLRKNTERIRQGIIRRTGAIPDVDGGSILRGG